MHVIIVGCGRVGARLAIGLALFGHDVVVVDKDPEAFSNLGAAFNGSTVTGVGIDADVLEQAGIQHADALAAVTSLDAVNVVAAQVAKEVYGVPRVIARVNEPASEENFREFGIVTCSPTDLGAFAIATMISNEQVQTLQVLGAGEAVLVEFAPPTGSTWQTLAQLEVPGKLRLVAVLQDGRAYLPGSPLDPLGPEDRVIAAVRRDLEQNLSALLAQATPPSLRPSE